MPFRIAPVDPTGSHTGWCSAFCGALLNIATESENLSESAATAPYAFTWLLYLLGGQLLLAKSFNASYGALPYEEKLPYYNVQNLLARSLHPECYQHHPGFLTYVKQTHLPFRSYEEFRRADLDERHDLYRKLAEEIWI